MRKFWFTFSLFLVATVTAVVPAVAVTPEEDPAGTAAAWLVEQYEDHPDTFGLGGGAGDIADLIFALAGADVGGDVGTTTLLPVLEAVAADYVATGTAALAKTILAVTAAGGDVTSFGDLDLAQLLDDAYDPSTGEFAANAFDQALAILALAATSDAVPTPATDFLLGLVCDDGGYAYDCTWGSDADTTALVAQALLSADADASGAVSWLLDQQQPDGSFHSFGAPSPNSTGLAAMALRAAGEEAAADAAADWMRAQQAGCGSEDAGAIGLELELFSVESATMQGLLAFGAPRYDQLDLTAAAADLPVVCAQDVVEPVIDTGADDVEEEPAGTGDERVLADTGSGDGWLAMVAGMMLLAGLVLLRVPSRESR